MTWNRSVRRCAAVGLLFGAILGGLAGAWGPPDDPRAAAVDMAFTAPIKGSAGPASADTPDSRRRLRLVVGDCVLEGPARLEPQLKALAERAAGILPRLEANLGVRARAKYRIILLPPGDLSDPELARLDASAPRWAAGFLIPARRVGAIRIARADLYPYGDLVSVLVHEATHMLLRDAVGGNLPRWFAEGVASGEERGWGLRDVLVYSSSLLTGRLPKLSEMDRAFEASSSEARTAYAASFDFLSWVRSHHGSEVVRDILREAASRPFPEAWEVVTGDSLSASEAAWRRSSLLLYRWVPALTGTTTLWILVTLLALLAAARRRARSRAILARWDAEGDGLE